MSDCVTVIEDVLFSNTVCVFLFSFFFGIYLCSIIKRMAPISCNFETKIFFMNLERIQKKNHGPYLEVSATEASLDTLI